MNKAEILAHLRFMRSQDFSKLHSKEHQRGREDAYDHMILKIEELDEPEEVVVPDFVAEWIEKCKAKGKTLDRAYSDFAVENVNVIKWLYHEGDRNEKINLFARAWLFGYMVEEKKYRVNIHKDGYYLVQSRKDEEVWFVNGHGVDKYKQESVKTTFTEKEINAIDPRYFQFREPVEEEE